MKSPLQTAKMKRKGIMDLEDFFFFLIYILFITVILIVISIPACKNKTTTVESFAEEDLRNFNAKQKLSGYLNTIMPSYEQLVELERKNRLQMLFPWLRPEGDESIISKGPWIINSENRADVKKYLKDNSKFYEGKSFAEFIGLLKYSLDKRDIDDSGLGISEADLILDFVTVALFSEPSCTESEDSSACYYNLYLYPWIQIRMDDYNIVNERESPEQDMASSSQSIPLPDGGIAVVNMVVGGGYY
jgi:hypothetical protein